MTVLESQSRKLAERFQIIQLCARDPPIKLSQVGIQKPKLTTFQSLTYFNFCKKLL